MRHGREQRAAQRLFMRRESEDIHGREYISEFRRRRLQISLHRESEARAPIPASCVCSGPSPQRSKMHPGNCARVNFANARSRSACPFSGTNAATFPMQRASLRDCELCCAHGHGPRGKSPGEFPRRRKSLRRSSRAGRFRSRISRRNATRQRCAPPRGIAPEK